MPLGSNQITEFLYKIRWILGIFCVLSLVLAMDYLFLHILLPMKRQSLGPTLDMPPVSIAEASNSLPGQKGPSLSTVKNCLKEIGLGSDVAPSPKELVEKLLAYSTLLERRKSEESFTVKDGDTKYELTTRFSQNGTSDSSAFQIAASGERSTIELSEPVEKFLDGKTVISSKIRMLAKFSNGWSLTYQMKGEEVTSLQMKTNSKILSCVGLACVCR